MNTVKTEVEKQCADNRVIEGSDLIRKAGEAVKAPLSKYVGSFVLHIYNEGVSIDTRTFKFVTQFVNEVPEALAIEGAKVLKTDMLARYGHVLKEKK